MIKLKINIWVTLLFSAWARFTLMSVGARSVPNPFEVVVNGEDQNETGTRWAVLVAGSNGYENYRHQADVCHAYQILKNGGLKDENIIVFMYDDIANDPQNPRPGIIINKPNGTDVYKGVPKDYTGNDTNAENFYAVLSGNRSALSGGSGKVVDSGPNDIIFIYYTDHGATGLVCMPVGDYVMAHDFVNVLKKKHAAKSYKKMVIYLEACESGSMFEGLLPNNINIYATTASKPDESSYAYYCPDSDDPPPPSEYETCLGDKYSISWLEDSDQNDLTKETLSKQYQSVHRRTLKCSVNESDEFSHVMQYGDKKFVNDFVATYLGAPDSGGHDTYYNLISSNNPYTSEPSTTQTGKVSQRDAYLLYLRRKLGRAQNGSKEKLKAQKELDDEIAHREHVDNVVHLIGNLLFGEENSSTMMLHVRPSGQPVVDDWDCFKTLIKTFESQCGALSSYGRKYTRVFANLCNAGISAEQMVVASSQACPQENHVS